MSLENVENKILEKEISTAKKAIDTIVDDLTDYSRAKVTEGFFKRNFVESLYLYMLNELPNENSGIILKWLEIAGNGYMEVDLINDVTNEYIMTIPPLYINKEYTDNNRNIDISNMTAGAKMRIGNAVNKESTYTASMLAKLDDLKESNDSTIINDWVNLFKRYLIPKDNVEDLNNNKVLNGSIKEEDLDGFNF